MNSRHLRLYGSEVQWSELSLIGSMQLKRLCHPRLDPEVYIGMTAMWSLQWYWRRGRMNSTDALMDSIKK